MLWGGVWRSSNLQNLVNVGESDCLSASGLGWYSPRCLIRAFSPGAGGRPWRLKGKNLGLLERSVDRHVL